MVLDRHRADGIMQRRLNMELCRKVASAITTYAQNKHADVIVFEYLEIKRKVSGKKKQKLHLWRKRDIQKLCEHQAHRNGMRVSRVCAWNTSRLAYDGTGAVARDSEKSQPVRISDRKTISLRPVSSVQHWSKIFYQRTFKTPSRQR